MNLGPSMSLRRPAVRPGNSRQKGSAGFLILTALTLSLLICWTPFQVFYSMSLFIYLDFEGVFNRVAGLLFYLEAVVDPIFFGLAVNDIRVELLHMLGVQGEMDDSLAARTLSRSRPQY